jgi:hypothetical protein
VGRTDAFVAMLEHMYTHNVPKGFDCDDHRREDGSIEHPNDQAFITLAFLDQPVDMRLDSHCNLCQTLCGCSKDEFEFLDEGIRNIRTNSYPKAFHFNGPAKTDGLREPIIEHLAKTLGF